ncbi:hypothetical protein OIDMADRAFT_25799 [Oidiodendron maius Zn]|uniref:BTB domain-containing protein n=1 Tax=Oidiodendron maius (strain Zn) TaxID=913774 RepID=A0A0C3DT20_OIDMZ|nr:hypothetical protein OIDMADRAFT_25799 [Oidiodendron maius Zn]
MAELEACVFRSKQFVFVIGDETKTEYTVHRDLIAKQSKALNALVNGEMQETLNGRVTFEDLDDNTFVRFCQFAYTGDYITPGFISDPNVIVPPSVAPSLHDSASDRESNDIHEPMVEPLAVAEEMPSDWGFKSTKPKKQSKSRLLRQSFDDKDYDIETPVRIWSARCEVRPNSSVVEDYTPVLLGHAGLYIFGEKWGIENLKILALHKLHKTLTKFTLFESRRRDIVELLRCVYSNENTPDRGEVVDELRSLVMLYVVCEAESLTQCSEFMALLGEGGELTEDFVQILMKRIK